METPEIQSGVAIPGRRILDADDLFSLKDAKPRLEWGRAFATPGGEQGEVTKAWAFSIDGYLNGQAIRGALFAGECMVVQAMTQEVAERVAKDGLAETIRLLREEYDARPITEPNIGILTDTGGRKGRGDGTLHSDPKLKAMIEHIIGGKPWKW